MKKILFVLVLLSASLTAQTAAPDSTLQNYFKQKEAVMYNRAKAIEQKLIRAKADLYDAEKEQAMLIAEYNLLMSEKKKHLEQKKVK